MRKYFSLIVLAVCISFQGYAISVKRTIFPNEIKSKGEVIVSVEVKKEGTAVGFARLVESIPDGFKAEELKSASGNFIVENGKLRIIWLTTPGDDTFRAEYKLIHVGDNHGKLSIAGKFHYVVNDKRLEMQIENSFLTVSKPVIKEEQKPAAEIVAVKVDPVIENPPSNDTTVTEVKKEEPAVVVEVKKEEPVAEVKKEEPVAETPAESAVVFKVQLGAYSSEKSQSIFGSLPDVHFIKSGKVFKYYSGKFSSESEARAVIADAKAQGFSGAFLVRFKDGKRI